MKKLNTKFQAPADWLKFETIDMHTGGEPLRVILTGLPDIEANSVLDYRRELRDNHDYIRQSLIWEPRGHADMYGCVIVPPNDEGADFGIIFLHNEGYSTMCGHATIAITKLAVELGWVEVDSVETKVVIDAPCGRLESFAAMKGGKVDLVKFHCVPSFVVALDEKVAVEGIGEVTYDLAYGGAFYAYVDATKLNLSLSSKYYREHIQIGMAIKNAVMNQKANVIHPFEEDLSFLYGTIFIEPSDKKGIDSRNVCVFAEGEVDRSPTGSGVSGRMAIHHQRGELAVGESMVIESITGSTFRASPIEQHKFGEYQAVIPEVEGTAYITGQHTFVVDPNDPMKDGFFLR